MNLKTLRRNMILLTFSSAFRGGTGFITNAYLARRLGPEQFGLFSFLFILNTVVFRFTAGGFDLVTTREVARDHSVTDAYASNVSTIRFFIVTLTTLAVTAFAWLQYDWRFAVVCICLAVTWAIFYVANVLFAALRGHELMQYEAVAFVVYSAATLLFAIVAVNLTHSAVMAGVAYVVGSIPLLLIAYGSYVFVFRTWPRPAFNWPLWRHVWENSWALAAANMLYVLYTRVDILVLSLFVDKQALGWYTAAYNIVVAAGLISTVVSTAILPQLSVAYVQDMRRFNRLYRRALALLVVAGLLIGVVATLSSGLLIPLIYGGGYEPAITAFQILSWAIVLSFINVFTNTALAAMNRVKVTMYIMLVALIVKIVINLLLVRPLGLYSAAIANVSGEFLVTAGMLVAIEYYQRHTALAGAAAPNAAGLDEKVTNEMLAAATSEEVIGVE